MTGTTLSCVKGSSKLMRPKFGPGMLLQADDLDALTTYSRDLNRLLFRSLFGCGVVCGLCVTPDEDECGDLTITVGAGLALGCGGDPIHVPVDQSFTVGDCRGDDLPDPPLWVLLCATSKCCAPRTASCGCDDDTPSSTPTRVRDCFEIRVVSKLPKCVCCYQDDQSAEKKDTENDDATLARDDSRKDDNCPCGPTDGCYTDHYLGKCANCDDCSENGSCDCNCVILAKLKTDEDGDWVADHRVRRFVRPIFMRDPGCDAKKAEAQGVGLTDTGAIEGMSAARAKKSGRKSGSRVKVKVRDVK